MTKKKGFSLVELIVVLGIITVAFLAILGLLTTTIRSARIARDNLIATNLAREALELVRHARDTKITTCLPDENTGTCLDWLNIIGGAVPMDSQAYQVVFSPFANGPVDFQASAATKLTLCRTRDRAKAVYVESASSCPTDAEWDTPIATPFTRTVTFTNVEGNGNVPQDLAFDRAATVTATVTWGEGTVALSTQLFNWYVR